MNPCLDHQREGAKDLLLGCEMNHLKEQWKKKPRMDQTMELMKVEQRVRKMESRMKPCSEQRRDGTETWMDRRLESMKCAQRV